jgi:hypothetical protein
MWPHYCPRDPARPSTTRRARATSCRRCAARARQQARSSATDSDHGARATRRANSRAPTPGKSAKLTEAALLSERKDATHRSTSLQPSNTSSLCFTTAPKRTSSYEGAAAVNLRATTTSCRQANKAQGHHPPSSVAITTPTKGNIHTPCSGRQPTLLATHSRCYSDRERPSTPLAFG